MSETRYSETTYTARPFGVEVLSDSAWVGAFPDGPLIHLNAVSFEILMSVQDAGHTPVSVNSILASLRERISGVPDDAEPVVKETLSEFARAGLIAIAPRGQTGVDTDDS